ncbi:MAG TPA: DUF2752 domain-containing protein [Bacteroidales bacterium]|nr:DUF2752 domain-containing protein [Bacteroidales bacterium]HPJ54802.1 DUF2752 domain-containing protein [Bacteroidales bacterium]HPQ55626.1 DUF2752 domain-containing protein [Bacteroidales bacterium]
MSNKRKITGIIALFLFLVMPLLIILFDPGAGHLQESQSFCPFKMLTGLPCPGCGMVKSMVSLYRGDLAESFRYHLFGPLLVLFFTSALFVMIAELIRGRNFQIRWLYNMKLAYGAAVLMGGYHLVRIILFVSAYSFREILHESIWF